MDEDEAARGAAEYVAKMLTGLREVAAEHRLDLLAYLIETALEEARARAGPTTPAE